MFVDFCLRIVMLVLVLADDYLILMTLAIEIDATVLPGAFAELPRTLLTKLTFALVGSSMRRL